MVQVNAQHSHLEIIRQLGKIPQGDRKDGIKNPEDGEVEVEVEVVG